MGMDLLTVFIVAIGLTFDSFAVSIISGLGIPKIRFFQAARFAIILAIFQAVMPIIGWLLQSSVQNFIEPIEHWVAFAILSLVGGKMIMGSLIQKEEEIKNPLKFRVAVVLAIATSIDALAVGFTLGIIIERFIAAILLIGAVTFIASMTGILIGKKTGPKVNKYAEIIGGTILFIIGAKILIEHLLLY